MANTPYTLFLILILLILSDKGTLKNDIGGFNDKLTQGEIMIQKIKKSMSSLENTIETLDLNPND